MEAKGYNSEGNMKYMTRDKVMNRSRYDDKLLITSETFDNVFYQVIENNIAINAIINNKLVVLPASFADIKRLMCEITEVMETWDM